MFRALAGLGLLASAAGLEGAIVFDSALLVEDECSAHGEGKDASCSFNAMQRRVVRRSALDTEAAYVAAPKHKGGWTQIRRCEAAHVHELAFVVRPGNLPKLLELALDLSNPASLNYRRWLTRAEVSELTRNDEALAALRGHLQGYPELSVLQTSRDGDVLRVHGPVSALERVLNTEFYVFKHDEHDVEIVRSPGYFLPGALQDHVEGVLGATEFEDMRPHRMASRELDLYAAQQQAGDDPATTTFKFGYDSYKDLENTKGDSLVSPRRLRQIYGVPGLAARGSELAMAQANTSQVVFGTLSQHWSPSDRTVFEASFDIPQDNYVKQLKGEKEGHAMSGDDECRNNPSNCAEANLDVQYMMAMSPFSEMGYWYVPEATADGMYTFLLEFMTWFVDAEKPAQVISISYGMPEYYVTKSAMMLFEALAMKLALQGVTILVASGDDGAASFLAHKRRRGKECWSVEEMGFQVSWPASSAWVTGVGATTGPQSGGEEVVCQTNYTGLNEMTGEPAQITSGGGFSKVFKKPAWQQGVYVYNASGRGVPDVALLGHNFGIVVGGRWITADGTSAAAPALGGMLSLINAELLAKGKPSIGFLNQLLYVNATAADAIREENEQAIFNDIVEGDNRCAALGAPCCGGYDARVGWDPVTGLGSVHIGKLRGLVLKMSGLELPN